MTARSFLKALAEYGRARLKFCEQVADQANNCENVEFMHQQGVTDLLIPLIDDPQLNVRINSINCLGRMVNYSNGIAENLIERNLPQLMLRQFIMEQNDNSYFKKVVMQTLSRMAKHSPQNAMAISEAGGFTAFLCCLEEQNIAVKEMAACGTGCLISKSPALATTAVNSGAVPLLLMCLQHNELSLKIIASLALGDLAATSPDHARAVAESTAILHLSRALNNIDTKLKRNVLYALTSIATHDKSLAEMVVDADVLPKAIVHTGHDSSGVRRQNVRLIQEISKHSMELAQLVVNSGGVGAIIQSIITSLKCDEDILSHAATALGYIAGQSPYFALAIIECKGVLALMSILCNESRTELQAEQAVWALGHIGKHTPEHSRRVGEENVFSKVLEFLEHPCSSDALKQKCKCTLKLCLQCCLHLPSLEPLLYNAPPSILKYILGQYSKILPNDPAARRIFITTGGLKKVQELRPEPGTHLFEYVSIITSCYPEDIVRIYHPDFPDSILERVDQFIPQTTSPILSENVSLNSCNDLKQPPPSRKSSKLSSVK